MNGVHIISQKRIVEAKRQYPNAATGLDNWYRIMKRTQFSSFNELRTIFPSADHVRGFYVFNIGGNQLRLIAALHFDRHKCYIREIFTHTEYDRWRP